MSPLTKGLSLLFGMPAILAISFVTYFSATGEKRMRAVCSQVQPGTTHAQLKQFAAENRLGVPAENTSHIMLEDARSYGRHACQVSLSAAVVQHAEYKLVD